MKTILFSPMGTHDPFYREIDKNTKEEKFSEGSFIQICKKIKPDIVYIYLSKKMTELENEKQLYTNAIKKLSEYIKKKIEIKIIKTDDDDNVANFDYYIENYKKILLEIKNTENENTIYVNVSSGTTQMKNALLLLGILDILDLRCCQVTTPEKAPNFPTDNLYSWAELKNNNDRVKILNESYTENGKKHESSLENLKCTNNEQKLIELINKYDYRAALILIKDMRYKERTNKYVKLVDIASKRLNFDINGTKKVINEMKDTDIQTKIKQYFLFDKNDDLSECYEYILNLKIKLKKNEYADFFRAINPILYNMNLILFEKIFGTIENFSDNDDRNVLNWCNDKLKNTEVLELLEKGFEKENPNKKFDPEKSGFIDSTTLHLATSEYYFKQKKDKEAKLLIYLDKIRGKRNKIAHEFLCVDDKYAESIISDKDFRSYFGITKDDYRKSHKDCLTEFIVDLLKELFELTFEKINIKYWNAYDKINEIIINRIKETTL